MPKYCAAAHCKNNSDKTNTSVSFFCIPKDPTRQMVWLKQIGRTDMMTKEPFLISKKMVCSIHFEKSMFAGIFANNRLKKTAVPTLFSEGIGKRAPIDKPIEKPVIVPPIKIHTEHPYCKHVDPEETDVFASYSSDTDVEMLTSEILSKYPTLLPQNTNSDFKEDPPCETKHDTNNDNISENTSPRKILHSNTRKSDENVNISIHEQTDSVSDSDGKTTKSIQDMLNMIMTKLNEQQAINEELYEKIRNLEGRQKNNGN